MKTALILAYDFPPYVSVGGLRPHYWYEHFKEMGIDPIVVTRNWNPIHGNDLDYIQPSETDEIIIEKTDKGTLIKTPYKPTLSNRLTLKGKNDKISNLLKKISTAWNEIGQWYLPIGTKYELYKATKSYLKNNKVDVILATGEPFILFKYASKLSKKFKIPWVADYRDPWSQSASRQKGILKWLSPYFEKKYLQNVTFIVTVSDFCEKKIASLLPNKPYKIIPNGYNEEVFKNLENIQQEKEILTISIAGTIYEWHPYEAFLKTVDEFLTQNPEARLAIRFYGINKIKEIQEIVQQSVHLEEVVEIHPKLPQRELIKALVKSNLLLLFNDYSVLGTKIYDYLALNRKIILCFTEDAEANQLKKEFYNMEAIEGLSKTLQADLIQETNSGIIVKNQQELENILNDLYDEFEKNGKIENHTIGAENYSRKVQTKKLVKNLLEIIKD